MKIFLEFSGACEMAAGVKKVELQLSDGSGIEELKSKAAGKMVNPPPFFLCSGDSGLNRILNESEKLDDGAVIRVVPVLLGG